MFKKFAGAALVLALAAAPAAFAEEKKGNDRVTFTAGLALYSDYMFRGISQTDNGPALQFTGEAAFTVNDYVTGYFGLFASNVEFVPEPAAPLDEEKAEIDFLVGFRGTIIENLSYDVKYIGYKYPVSSPSLNYDYNEYAIAFSYDFGVVIPTVGVNYSPDFFGSSGVGIYSYIGAKVPLPFLPYDARILGNYGRQKIDRNGVFGTPDYSDWNLGIFATVFGFDIGVQYVDTNLSKRDCFGAGSLTPANDTCDARAVFSIGRTFTF